MTRTFNPRKLLASMALCTTLLMGMATNVFAYSDPETEEAFTETETAIPETSVEESTDQPLIPEGNAELADDMNYGDKQLITVTTKTGNYFYILIDRSNEDKETSVHFLNQVDEADLMALMDEDEISGMEEDSGAIPDTTTGLETSESSPEPTTQPEETEKPTDPESKNTSNSFGYLILIAICVLAVLVFYFFKMRNRDTEEEDDETAYGGEDQPDDEEEEVEDDTPSQTDTPFLEPIAEEELNYPNPDDYPDNSSNDN